MRVLSYAASQPDSNCTRPTAGFLRPIHGTSHAPARNGAVCCQGRPCSGGALRPG